MGSSQHNHGLPLCQSMTAARAAVRGAAFLPVVNGPPAGIAHITERNQPSISEILTKFVVTYQSESLPQACTLATTYKCTIQVFGLKKILTNWLGSGFAAGAPEVGYNGDV
jgi:hypothetical protein